MLLEQLDDMFLLSFIWQVSDEEFLAIALAPALTRTTTEATISCRYAVVFLSPIGRLLAAEHIERFNGRNEEDAVVEVKVKISVEYFDTVLPHDFGSIPSTRCSSPGAELVPLNPSSSLRHLIHLHPTYALTFVCNNDESGQIDPRD